MKRQKKNPPHAKKSGKGANTTEFNDSKLTRLTTMFIASPEFFNNCWELIENVLSLF